MTYLTDTPDFNKIKKVLLVKLRHLGDVVLSTATISALKSAYPHLEIDMLVNQEAAGLLKGLKQLNKILTYRRADAKKGLLAKIKLELGLIREVRKNRYDLVINLTEGDKGNLLAILSKAKYRVGQKQSRYETKLTHLYKKAPIKRHSVERDLDALRRLGIYPSEDQKSLLLHISEQTTQKVLDILNQKGIKDYIIVHPVSRWMYKSPQSQFFVDLIGKLDLPVLITGSNQGLEKKFIDDILEKVEGASYFSTEGCLEKLMAVVKNARGIVTVDSLPLHIASCFKTPTVALFGPTSELDWGPWHNPKAKVISYSGFCRACYQDGCGGGKLSDCLEKIDKEAVIAACRDVFQEGE